MKRRGPGPCPVRQGDDLLQGAQRRKLTNYLVGSYLLHLQQSMRSRAGRRFPTPTQAYLRCLPLCAVKPLPAPQVGPLDLSTTKRPKPHGQCHRAHTPPPERPQSPSPKTPNLPLPPKPIGPNELRGDALTWRPLARPLSLQATPNQKLEWVPVVRQTPPESKPKFFPLPPGPHGAQRFPWMNSLKRIFLQEKTTAPEGEGGQPPQEESSPSIPAAPAASDSSSVASPVESVPPPAPAPKPLMSSNPFKIPPSNSWPGDHPEQHSSKPILAPSKFGFGRLGSGVSGSGAKRGPSPPLSTVASASPPPCESKTPFRLKPSVLGKGTPVPSSPAVSFASKRPASKARVNDGSDSGDGSDSEPDSGAKRARTSPPREGPLTDSSLSPCLKGTDVSGTPKSSPTSSEKRASPSSASPSKASTSPSRPVPTFVPLSSAPRENASTEDSPSRVNGVGAVSPTLSSKVGNAGFIFGQNLENRVSGVAATSGASALAFSNGETHPLSPSSGQNLFKAAVSSLGTPSSTSESGKSLSETSREFSLKEESLKTKYEEVEIVTGEEGEKNVIQMNCKLYGWHNGSWQERGRGILRLNDREIRDELHSRLVIRTQGTLTVMLNAKIWGEMSVEKSNDKTVIFTASGASGQPKIYLVMGSPKDITLLHNSLEYRVAAARSQTLDEKEREREAEQDGDNLLPLPV